MKHPVCNAGDLQPGQMKAIEVAGKALVLIRGRNGDFYALRNICPHKGPELSDGFLDINSKPSEVGEYCLDPDTEVIRCPWHSWEFDIKTGCSLFDPEGVRVRIYDVSVEADVVYVNV